MIINNLISKYREIDKPMSYLQKEQKKENQQTYGWLGFLIVLLAITWVPIIWNMWDEDAVNVGLLWVSFIANLVVSGFFYWMYRKSIYTGEFDKYKYNIIKDYLEANNIKDIEQLERLLENLERYEQRNLTNQFLVFTGLLGLFFFPIWDKLAEKMTELVIGDQLFLYMFVFLGVALVALTRAIFKNIYEYFFAKEIRYITPIKGILIEMITEKQLPTNNQQQPPSQTISTNDSNN
ncbi:hypothetical protein [Pontibacillus halophilus]|uniref:hypothetical protein n=1 Tax=Pontibacillus halophilus TaxID=516704 RepID=UPI0004028D79|nr:hypothetical protein [Pontibacillus halophilus]